MKWASLCGKEFTDELKKVEHERKCKKCNKTLLRVPTVLQVGGKRVVL